MPANYLIKLEALAATGMPGVYKLLIFFLIQHVYGLNTLGDIASWQSIAQIFSYFTAIGWASLILVRVAKANSNKERLEEFNRLSLMGGLTLLVIIIMLLISSVILKNAEDAAQVIYWLVAWTLYQLPRHYMIALKEYRKALLLDVTIIAVSLCSVAFARAEDSSLCLAVSMMISGILAIVLIQRSSETSFPKIGYEIKGLEFALVNFLSGGISLSLIPLAAYFQGKAFAGAISLFVSLSAIALLVPRAISLNQLPTLAKVIHNPDKLTVLTESMRSQVRLSNILTTCVCLIIGAAVYLQTKGHFVGGQFAISLVLITLQSSASIQSQVDSNILMAAEQSRSLLKLNAFTSVGFVAITSVLAFWLTKGAFVYLCVAILVLNLYRTHQTRAHAKYYL